MPPKKEMIGSDDKTYSDSKWDMLLPDLIRLVLERLNFAAFHKARSISLDWYSTAELCMRQNPTPWIILFPSNEDDSCKLFDPHHEKTYFIRDLGFGFFKSRCLANSGSWFLMLDHETDFHLLNIFTRERIPLPTLEAIDGLHVGLERVDKSDFMVTMTFPSEASRVSSTRKVKLRSAVLWVDERSRDYLVVWNFDEFWAYQKKGDSNKTWKVHGLQGRVDMVFKDSKLYVLRHGKITVFDFSGGGSPKECASFPTPVRSCYGEYFNNIVVTLSGEILIISCIWRGFYNLYKMDPKSSGWSIINSIGDEALLLNQGVTVAAKDGVKKNCIYFSNDKLRRFNRTNLREDNHCICILHIKTKAVVQVFPHLTDSSPIPFKNARWFFPTFGGKWLL